MSGWAPTLTEALAAYDARIAEAATAGDVLASLADFLRDQGRRGADTVFLKVNGEEGWTQETGQRLADYWVNQHMLAITDAVHEHDGEVELAQEMVKVAVTAFGERLRDLAGSFGTGGSA